MRQYSLGFSSIEKTTSPTPNFQGLTYLAATCMVVFLSSHWIICMHAFYYPWNIITSWPSKTESSDHACGSTHIHHLLTEKQRWIRRLKSRDEEPSVQAPITAVSGTCTCQTWVNTKHQDESCMRRCKVRQGPSKRAHASGARPRHACFAPADSGEWLLILKRGRQ